MRQEAKKFFQNFAILLLLLSTILNLLEPYLIRLWPVRHLNLYSYIAADHDIGQILLLTLSFIGLILVYKLYKRIRFAWMIEIMAQSALLVLHLMHGSWVFTLPNIFILLVLGVSYRDFKRASDRIGLKRAIWLAASTLIVVLLNSVLSLAFFHNTYRGVNNLADSLWHSVLFIFTMDANQSGFTSHIGLIYANTLIIINWIFIIGSILLILKPLIVDPWTSRMDRHGVFDLVEKYGQNPLSYLALEEDKNYFFGDSVRGVAAYTIKAGVFIVCGDPICAVEDATQFLAEIMGYVHKNELSVAFLAVTENFLSLYRDFGFSTEKIGEDAVCKLADFNLKGGKIAKVRAAINFAKRQGISVKEYQPSMGRDHKIENEMNEITRLWFKEKGEPIGFILGGTGLANPLGRRYFYSVDSSGRMLSFIVLLPYKNGQSYLVDITRRRSDAQNGAMQMTIVEAFLQLKEEGKVEGNLGLCTLANVKDEEGKNSFATYLFSFIYDNVRGIYDFQGLFQAKKKFNPTDWQARYIAFYPKTFSPKLVLAVLQAQGVKLRTGKNKVEKI